MDDIAYEITRANLEHTGSRARLLDSKLEKLQFGWRGYDFIHLPKGGACNGR
jgi:hypothetical protein